MFLNLGKALVGVVTLPIDVASDILTFGSLVNDKSTTYTGEKLSRIAKHMDEATK
jgi:hypothetical protein